MKPFVRMSAVLLSLSLFPVLDAWAGAKMAFVGPKSLYAKVGLRTDDEVLSIDGKVPTSASEVGQTLYALHGDGKVHHIKVLRNGAHEDLTFQ